jgi:hypothetical protein
MFVVLVSDHRQFPEKTAPEVRVHGVFPEREAAEAAVSEVWKNNKPLATGTPMGPQYEYYTEIWGQTPSGDWVITQHLDTNWDE